MLEAQDAASTASKEAVSFAAEYATPVLWSLVIIALAYVSARWARHLVLAACKRAEVEPTAGKFFAKLSGWVILLIAASFVLGKFGVDTASLSVLLGAVGLAIGLAFQGTLSNFASGIMLMIFRPYKIGDTIVAAGQTGIVYEIDLVSTTLDTFDNKRIFIPNSSIFGSVITNVSFHARRRVDVIVTIAHGADVDATRTVLTRAAEGVPGRLAEPVEVVLTDIGPLGAAWQVQVWASAADYLAIRQAALREVKTALDRAAIAFANPVAPAAPLGR